MKRINCSFIGEKKTWLNKQRKVQYKINKNNVLALESRNHPYHYAICFKRYNDALHVCKNIDISNPIISYDINLNVPISDIEYETYVTSSGENVISLIEASIFITLRKRNKNVDDKVRKSISVPYVFTGNLDDVVTLPMKNNLGIAFIEKTPDILDGNIILEANLLYPYYDLQEYKVTLEDLLRRR